MKDSRIGRGRFAALALACMLAGGGHGARAADATGDAARYLDLLDMHGSPKSAGDRSFNIFFDAGAWHGYSLPAAGESSSGFSGPFVHSLAGGQWAGTRFATLTLRDATGRQALPLSLVAEHAGPGFLERSYGASGLTVRQTLFFADSMRALVRTEITAADTRDVALSMESATMAVQGSRLEAHGRQAVQTFDGSPWRLVTTVLANEAAASATANGYRLELARPLRLKPGQTATIFVEQALLDGTAAHLPGVDGEAAWSANRERWAGYLKHAAPYHLPGVADDVADRVATKAKIILLGNWRAARGDLHHDGVIPSYSNPDFNGFWAWDSWKHAAALAQFAPDLAREQMRAMFDYQADDGMVPDCLYLDKAENNWRDTKPPLATWATLAIYHATGDRAFVGEMYDKLLRYHRWWFKARDHDHDGLAEYGSTDGTRIAAAWESGMDNAVRFDGASMVRNGDGAWSLNQESVDLNAYLYREKLELAELAGVLGKRADQAMWLREAAAMKTQIQQAMFDAKAGYFFDIRLGSHEPVRVYGPEGWMPLWAGVATPEQAQAVSRVMMAPDKFGTLMPFPTLARDNPKFSPIKGYWRGPVWLDQAYFGVEALRRYGLRSEADDMARRLVINAQGLTGQGTTYENYDPLTGHGYQSPNFSWSAASYLLLIEDASSTSLRGQDLR
ncbi:MGH1-like glycoside hydrolase domain-containing protein [Dyella telluris]|uniref:Glycoside hydrolase n=1 Tax=Dyella telluris TaxID=2763498 RepID=A0A7G8Q4X5_9GAMM|nr:trehalase family glycosidase [Dyella telluris]QNK01833.1 glycoside hydrolase [Dyella telluris]